VRELAATEVRDMAVVDDRERQRPGAVDVLAGKRRFGQRPLGAARRGDRSWLPRAIARRAAGDDPGKQRAEHSQQGAERQQLARPGRDRSME
jgi:hypothetical protein